MLPDITTLQLLFAQYNYTYFNGEIPTHRIGYNARFSNLAGRITYRPPFIELSTKHLERNPESLRDTLLHEMIHAWLFVTRGDTGHSAAFKKKMRELGLKSIYHDMGAAREFSLDTKRYILRCDHCAAEILRRRRPPAMVSCARCSRGRYNARYQLKAYEITGLREAELSPVALPAAHRSQR